MAAAPEAAKAAETPTPEDTKSALEYVTTRVLDVADGGTQALGISDFTKLDAMKLGSMNRNVNAQWVADLVKTMFQELHTKRERTMLTLCIDLTQVSAALVDEEARASFCAVILDGQHRWSAMKAIREAYPGTNIPFWVTVHLVHSDAEQQDIIAKLDRRSNITDIDRMVMESRKRFKDALMCAVGPSNLRRHCFIEAADHAVLREPRISAALARRVTSVEVASTMIDACSTAYEARYAQCAKGSLRGGQRAMIKASQLYFFMADPREWVSHMVVGDPIPPLPDAAKRQRRARPSAAEREEAEDADYVPPATV